MTTTSKEERLNKAFIYLISKGLVKSKADVARKMNTTRSVICVAFKATSDTFLLKFNAAYDNTFNTQWLLTGEGDFLSRTIGQNTINAHNNIDRQNIHNQTNGNYSPVIENNDVTNSILVNRLLDELSATRGELTATRKQNDTLIELLKKQMEK